MKRKLILSTLGFIAILFALSTTVLADSSGIDHVIQSVRNFQIPQDVLEQLLKEEETTQKQFWEEQAATFEDDTPSSSSSSSSSSSVSSRCKRGEIDLGGGICVRKEEPDTERGEKAVIKICAIEEGVRLCVYLKIICDGNRECRIVIGGGLVLNLILKKKGFPTECKIVFVDDVYELQCNNLKPGVKVYYYFDEFGRLCVGSTNEHGQLSISCGYMDDPSLPGGGLIPGLLPFLPGYQKPIHEPGGDYNCPQRQSSKVALWGDEAKVGDNCPTPRVHK